MTRRAGLIALLLSVVLAVLLGWALRTPSPISERPEAEGGPADAANRPSELIPTWARSARVVRGRFRGGQAPAPEGFDASISAIPLASVLDTNVRAQDLPPLDEPQAGSPTENPPADEDAVLGVVIDGTARAYPLRTLNHHWAVNDVVDGRRVLVLWDPISGVAAAYQGGLDERAIAAGASGKWYAGNALFYDRGSTSLFPAITGRFVTGPLAERALRPLPFRRETWKAWRERYPSSRVLRTEVGGEQSVDPFAALETQPDAFAAILPADLTTDRRLPLTEWVIGFVDPIGKPMCCAIEDLPENKPLQLDRAQIERQPGGGARVTLSGGVWPQQTVCRYFAWAGAHPDTEVWASNSSPRPPEGGTEADR